MRKGKRLLAGIAAGGLAAGLISFTGAGVANAAAPGKFTTVTSFNDVVLQNSNPEVVRTDDATYDALDFGIVATPTAGAGTDTVEVFYQANPFAPSIRLSDDFAPANSQSIDLSGNNTVILEGEGDTRFQTTGPLTNIGYQVSTTAGGNANQLFLLLSRDAAPGLYTMCLWSGGSPASQTCADLWISEPPDDAVWLPVDERSIAPGGTAEFTVTVVDNGGRPSYLKGAESLVIGNSSIEVDRVLPADGSLDPADINAQNAESVWEGGITSSVPFPNVTFTADNMASGGFYSVYASPSFALASEGVTTAYADVFVVQPSVTAVTWPQASRAQQTQTLAVSGTFPANTGTATWEYDFCAVPGTSPGAYESAGDQPFSGTGSAGQTALFDLQAPSLSGTVAGTYSIAMYYRTDASSTDVCDSSGRPSPDSIALTPGRLITFGGPIASITQTPANVTVAPGSTAEMTVQAFDTAGRRTLPLLPGSPVGAADTLSYSTANSSIATVDGSSSSQPFFFDIDLGILGYEVEGVAPGNTTVRTTSSNSSVAAAISQVGVASPGATTVNTSVGLSQPNVVECTTAGLLGPCGGNEPFNRKFLANPTVTSFTFNVTGLQPAQTYAWSVDTSGVVASAYSGTVTASATGTASQTINVIAGVPETFDSVSFRILGTPANAAVGGGAGAAKSATVTYSAPVTDFYSPVDGQTIFAAAGASVPVAITAATQYGALAGGSSVSITNAAGTVVASGVTNAQGQVTLNVTAPASGFTSFTISGQTATATPIDSIMFWVNTNTPTVTIPSGPGATVQVPWIDGLVNTGIEAVPMVIRVNATGGADTTAVSVSGSEGVRFFTSDPNSTPVTGGGAWNAGTATATVLTTAGQVTVWAYSTKTGTNTVTASAGGQTVNGTFTAANAPGAARNLTVEAPASITTAELAVLTMKLTDVFGNPVDTPATAPMSVRLKDGSIGTFGNGLRQTTVDFDGAGTAQVSVGSAVAGKIEVVSGTTTFGQFGAAAGVPGAGFEASNAPKETSINVTEAKAMAILQASRDARTGAGLFNGVASGFAADAKLNVRVKVWNEGNGSWSKWKAGGQVALSNVVDSAGNRSFAGVVTIGNGKALKVRVTKDGINSESVTIPGR